MTSQWTDFLNCLDYFISVDLIGFECYIVGKHWDLYCTFLLSVIRGTGSTDIDQLFFFSIYLFSAV